MVGVRTEAHIFRSQVDLATCYSNGYGRFH